QAGQAFALLGGQIGLPRREELHRPMQQPAHLLLGRLLGQLDQPGGILSRLVCLLSELFSRERLRRKVVCDDWAASQEDGPGDAEDCLCHSLDALRGRWIQPVALSLRERTACYPLAEREGYRTMDYSPTSPRPKAR